MSANKFRVAIRLESESEGQGFVQNLDGELYPKGDHVYLRYKEVHEELGDTSALIRLQKGQIRLIRQGDVSSEQIFIPGEQHTGTYTTPHGTLPIETLTEYIDFNLTESGLGVVEWKYKLSVNGSESGTFMIKLTVREAKE